jgi:ribosomal protein S18 acetylase RimI-like enzyme
MSEIRQLDVNDIEALRQLLRTCWLDTYTGLLPDSAIRTAITVWQSRDSILRGMNAPQSFYAGYIEDGKLLGMVSAGKINDNTAKVFQLYVLPNHQRKGIGSKLMDVAVSHFDKVRKIILEVEESNTKGISFYEKYGFAYPSKTVVKVNGDEIPCLVGELALIESI